jgi:hypothetical protein
MAQSHCEKIDIRGGLLMCRFIKPVTWSNIHTPPAGFEHSFYYPVQVKSLLSWRTHHSPGRRIFRILLAALVTALIFLVVWPRSPAAGAPQTQGAEFLLFYSNDVRGETEPCG